MHTQQTFTKKTVFVALKSLLAGLCAGIVLQLIVSQNTPYEARLIGDVPTITKYHSTIPTRKVSMTPSERFAQRVKQRLLAHASRNPTLLTFLGEGTLHNAAPAIFSSEEITPIISVERTEAKFPPFTKTVMPVAKVPNWGAMYAASQWSRTYAQMSDKDFVAVPAYNLSMLTTPMAQLLKNRTPESTPKITTKLFYSTRFFGAYDLDAGEFTAVHPGLDLKLAAGTPINAIAGGRVYDVRQDKGDLGLHVWIEHRLQSGEIVFSIYGHMDAATVQTGDTVTPGQNIGTVGMTGNTTAPHLHLQVQVAGSEPQAIYWPTSVPAQEEAARHVVNPLLFIQKYAGGL